MFRYKPLITIIIPFYNNKDLLKKYFIKNKKLVIFNQGLVEIIYIDDGSSDKGNNFLINNLKKLDNIKLFKLKNNSGPGIARNLGLRKAKGKNIIFLDVDDELIENGFIKLLNKIKKNLKNDLIFLNYIKKSSKQINLSSKNFNKNMLIKNFLRTELDMGPNFYLFNKKFLIDQKIFFKKGFFEDILFMLKVFTKIKKFQRFKSKVYKKNLVSNSITNSFSFKHVNDFNKTCLDKINYFNKHISKKIRKVSYDDLQYGLRGDYIFSRRLLNNYKPSKKNIANIKGFFKKILTKNFIALTRYDNIVLEELFKK